MNSTSLNPLPLSNYSALQQKQHAPGYAPAAKGNELNRRSRRNKTQEGDPLGNAVVTIFRAGEYVVGSISSAMTGLLPQTHPGEVTIHENAGAEPAIEHHPLAHASAALADDPILNEALLGVDFGYVGEAIGRGLMEVASWRIGPPGAAASTVTEEPPGQCPMDANGSPQCAKEAKKTAPPAPSLSIFSLAHLDSLKNDFKVVVSPSLKRRADQSLSNVIIVIVDYDHYDTRMQKLINDTLARFYESNDKFFAETAADETPKPAYCRGFPASDCAGIDDPKTIKQLLGLGKESTDAGRSAQHLIAKLAPNKIQPITSADYGIVRAAYTKAFGMVRNGQIEVTGKNADQLMALIDKISAADSKYRAALNSDASHRTRNDHMIESLKREAGNLNGRKAFSVIGAEHINRDIDKDGSTMQSKLLADIDCVILHQKKYKPEELKSSSW